MRILPGPNNWFPRLDLKGKIVAGRGAINIDGNIILSPAYNPIWKDTNGPIVTLGAGDVPVQVNADGSSVIPLSNIPSFLYAAGAGKHYIVPPQPVAHRIIECTIDPLSGEIITLVEHNGSNDDRSIFINHTMEIARGPIWQVRSLGGFIVYRHARLNTMGFMGGQTLQLNMMQGTWEGHPIPIHGGTEWWVLVQTNVDLRIRPYNNKMGYIIATGEDMNFNPDAIGLGDRIRVVWNDKNGVGYEHEIFFNEARVDTSAPIGQPVPPKPIPPEPIPPTPVPPKPIPPEPIPPIPVPPKPPVLRDSKYWFAPNIQSLDMLSLFDDEIPNIGEAGVFQLYIQEILNFGDVGPNTFEALVSKDVFKKLRAAGIALSIECGAVKPGNCQALDSIRNITEAIKRVRAAGGEVTHVAMDEPMVGAQGCPNQNITATADYTANFIKATRALGIESVGWIEAWPHIRFADQEAFLKLLVERGAKPSFWHLDMDWRRADKEGKSPPIFIQTVKRTAATYGILYAVILISTQDPISPDSAWYSNVKAVTRRVQTIEAQIPRLVVQSWTRRSQTNRQDIPANLGSTGLLASLTDVIDVFGKPAIPDLPTPEGGYMIAYGPVMPGFSAGDLVDNPNGTVSVKKPNGKFLCVTPQGKVEERDSPGGLWESFKDNGNSLVAIRDLDGKTVVYVLPLVDA